MRRGEVWAYRPKGSPRHPLAVVLSSNGLNESPRSWLLGTPVAVEDPQDILAVPIEGHGWASAATLTRFYRPWLDERVDVLDADTVEQLDAALRAALDL